MQNLEFMGIYSKTLYVQSKQIYPSPENFTQAMLVVLVTNGMSGYWILYNILEGAKIEFNFKKCIFCHFLCFISGDFK